MKIRSGTTSFVTTVAVLDSASSTGGRKTGLVYNSAGLTCYYKRSNGTASVAVTLATITTLGTFASGGFKEIDATNQPGLYEFHPPDAALAAGASEVVFVFKGASGMVQVELKIDLAGSDISALGGNATASDNLKADYDGTATNTSRSMTAKFVADVVESGRGHHTWSGSAFYVDGQGGNDTTGNGSRALPYATITKALTQCSDNRHDLIILLPNTSGNPNTITETSGLTVNKRYTFIRGPGRDVKITRSGAGDVVTMTANGCELSGCQVVTAGTGQGIKISSSDFNRVSNVWIPSAHQDAVEVAVGTNTILQNVTITAPGRDGVRVSSGAGSGSYTQVLDSIIRDCVGSAVNLMGSDASECRIQRTTIRDNAVGITVGSGVLDTIITDNRQINNTVWIADGGTRTLDMWNNLQANSDGYIVVNEASLVPYFPDTATRTIGDNDGGTVSDLQSQNGISFDTGENASTGLEVRISISATTVAEGPRRVTIRARYDGGATHSVNLYKYDYALASEVLLKTYSNSASFELDSFLLTANDQNPGTGAMELRFRHSVVSYNAAHAMRVDYVLFEKSAAVASIVDANVVSYATGLSPYEEISDLIISRDFLGFRGLSNFQFSASFSLDAGASWGVGASITIKLQTLVAGVLTDGATLGVLASGGWTVDGGWAGYVNGTLKFECVGDCPPGWLTLVGHTNSQTTVYMDPITFRFPAFSSTFLWLRSNLSLVSDPSVLTAISPDHPIVGGYEVEQSPEFRLGGTIGQLSQQVGSGLEFNVAAQHIGLAKADVTTGNFTASFNTAITPGAYITLTRVNWWSGLGADFDTEGAGGGDTPQLAPLGRINDAGVFSLDAEWGEITCDALEADIFGQEFWPAGSELMVSYKTTTGADWNTIRFQFPKACNGNRCFATVTGAPSFWPDAHIIPLHQRLPLIPITPGNEEVAVDASGAITTAGGGSSVVL